MEHVSMAVAVIALVIALAAAGGALWAIVKGVEIATRKPTPKPTLPEGKYTMKKVEGTTDVYDLTPVDEEKKEDAR
jgi:hypothetical protein